MSHARNSRCGKHARPAWRIISAMNNGEFRLWRRGLPLSLLLFLGIPNAHAQRFEVTPFFGARFGGTINLAQQNNPNADFMKIRSSSNYGVMADVSFFRHWQGEFIWSRQPTSLSVHNPNDGTFTYVSKLNLDTYQFGLTYQFRKPEAKLRPFLVFGVGFPHYSVPVINGTVPFAGSLGGGVKYYFTRNFGIRFETRWLNSETTYKGMDLCTYNLYAPPEPCPVNYSTHQGQVNLGLILRFK